ncbi:U-box domain-containing protein 4 [Gossypium australe]|uniref:RING-type E3 ubiquitin transferase n=1 Tax=Gossypium australe TaxID=47621 RepID=A0A5B6UHQ4_9ROSI|nr:U-box domain-containing protein 4 [Gossypium australe]
MQAGAVRYLVDLMSPTAGMVDKAVVLLANLATIPEGRTAIAQEGGIPRLVEVVELGSVRGKEHATATLLQLCTCSSRSCNVVLQGTAPPLVALSRSGTPRAKGKAQCLFLFQKNINSEPVQKYYQRAEEILKLLKPIILNAIVDSEIISDEVLDKAFEELGLSVEELREQFESWQPLSSKVYFVLQVEALISRIQNSSLDIFQSLKSSNQHLPDELSSASLEHCLQKIKHVGYKQISSVIREAVRDQVDGVGPSSEILMKIFGSLSLNSNQEILIEAVALEKLKENAEQAEKTAEVLFMDQLIALVSHMHHHLVLIKQSQACSPVLIPADFCCPLSLELMTDPVIVASGQTYERAFIKNWIDLGLTVCPKTRQTLAHINLIPNYTVKALITNWCESNNVKLPDPMKSMNLNQPHPPLVHESKSAESGLRKDSNSFLHSRSSQSMSLKSWSPSQSGKNLITSSGLHREAASLIHPCSTSEGSLPGITEDRSNVEQRGSESVGQPPMSPIRKEFHNTGHSSQNHTRSDSTSSSLSNSDFPGGAVGDNSETSERSTHVAASSNDISGEMKSDPQPAASAATSQREPEFSSRLMDAQSRSQTMWRRPTERLLPRIFCCLTGFVVEIVNVVGKRDFHLHVNLYLSGALQFAVTFGE